MKELPRHDTSVSEIEFCTLYVVAERWILDCILRFMHAKNHFSDTLIPIHPRGNLGTAVPKFPVPKFPKKTADNRVRSALAEFSTPVCSFLGMKWGEYAYKPLDVGVLS
jgi:hypothetical protein